VAQPRVAILGAGPTAAYVYRACLDKGIHPQVFGKEMVHGPHGAFWLYWLPQSVSTSRADMETILITKTGTVEEYRRKIWGEVEGVNCSFPTQDNAQMSGYDPDIWIPKLWGKEIAFDQREFVSDKEIYSFAEDWDIVFQTFPTFESRLYMNRIPIEICTYMFDMEMSSDNMIEYNGDPDFRIYRSSNLFGVFSTESAINGEGRKTFFPPSVGHLYSICKTIAYKIDPRQYQGPDIPAEMPDNLAMVGRHATWTAHRMAHRAYSLVRRYLAVWEMGVGGKDGC